jgi:hypothetical protein
MKTIIQNSDKVMVEILNVPNDIPADLLDKAECVIVGWSTATSAQRSWTFSFSLPHSHRNIDLGDERLSREL